MKELKILIYDDDKEICESLKSILIKEIGKRKALIETANDMNDAKEKLKQYADIIFLDIELDDSNNGIEFAEYIRKNYPDTKIVFITAHMWYSEDICPVNPDGFIVKPFKLDKLRKILEHIYSKLKNDVPTTMRVKISKNEVAQVFLHNVAFIETSGRKQVFYNLDKQKLFSACESMNDIEEKLPPNFIRCHHSFCINFSCTSDVQRYYALLDSGIIIPVSQNKYKNTKQQFVGFMGRDL